MPEATLLGISGSLRRGSHNTLLLHAAARELPEGVTLRIYRGLAEVPPYNEDQDVDRPPAAVARLRQEIAAADGLLLATPEYNQSIPGQLKNAVDWLSRPIATNVLRNKPVAVVGASTGMFGAVWAQAELRKVLAATGARVVEGEVPVGHAQDRFDDDGRLNEPNLEQALGELVRALVAEMRPLAGEAAAA